MWRILMFVCVFSGISCIFAEVIFNIKVLNDNSISCKQTLENPAKAVVLENEDIRLRVNYSNINYIQCVGKNNASYIFVKRKEVLTRNSVTSIKATTVMSGLWVCTIYTNMDIGIEPYKYIKELNGKFTELICHVHVHVRVSNTPQKVLVNNLTIPTSRVNNIEEDFDHAAEYHYLNGDIVTVRCIPVIDIVTSTIEFNYDFAENLDNMFKEVMKNKRAQLFGFHTKLQAQHDKSVMICKYHGENDHTTIKVTFILKQTIESSGYITVNGLIVRPHYSINGLNSEIDYFSFDGENVEIVCSSSSGLETADNKNCYPGGQTFNQSLITPFDYNCYLCKDKRGIKHIKVSSQKLDSSFKERMRLHVDIPSNNILIELFKYEEDIRYSWIYYEFEEGEHIVPKCTEYKVNGVISVLEVKYYLNEKEQKRNVQVKLTSGYENNVFKCEIREAASQPPLIYKQIKVLFRKKPLTTTTTTTTTTSTTNSMEPIITMVPQLHGNSTADTLSLLDEIPVWAIAVLAVLMCVVLSCVITVICKMKKRSPKRESGANNYENLQNQNSQASIPPYPEQWSQAEEQNYHVPVDTRNEGNIYAEPVRGPDDPYATPIPKSQRPPKGRQDDPGPTYAELNVGGNIGDPQYSSVKELYTQVVPKSLRHDNKNNYGNVFPNSSYVNSGNTEYVEPTYCQPFKK